jgi:uncharacterized protein (TIRG00374 family)
LLWYVYKDLNLAAMFSRLASVNYFWVFLSLIIALTSHVIRAYRWNLLLSPLGYKMSTFRTFLAVMVGYFVNLLLPRMGEISRCGMLKRTDDVPITTSLGTVVAERIIDVISLFVVVALTLLLEFQRLKGFFFGFATRTFENFNLLNLLLVLGITGIISLVIVLLVRSRKEQLGQNSIFQKIKSFAQEMLKGLTSINKLNNPAGFWVSSVLIWVLYYLMSYTMFFTLPETSHLGLLAGLAVLTTGSLGMAAPVQGGIGTFHILVSGVLVLYGISEQDGVLFATLTHGIQTLSFVIFGGISFAISLLISRRKAKVQSLAKSV